MSIVSWLRACLRRADSDSARVASPTTPASILSTPAADRAKAFIADAMEKQERYATKRRACAAQAKVTLDRSMEEREPAGPPPSS